MTLHPASDQAENPLLEDWLTLPAAQRQALLLAVQQSLVSTLALSAGSLQPSRMLLYAFFRRPSSLVIHLVVDDYEYRDVQSGSEVMEHYVWTCEAVFTIHHTFLSANPQLAYQHDVIEYQWEGYSHAEVRAPVAEKALAKLRG